MHMLPWVICRSFHPVRQFDVTVAQLPCLGVDLGQLGRREKRNPPSLLGTTGLARVPNSVCQFQIGLRTALIRVDFHRSHPLAQVTRPLSFALVAAVIRHPTRRIMLPLPVTGYLIQINGSTYAVRRVRPAGLPGHQSKLCAGSKPCVIPGSNFKPGGRLR